MLFAKAGWSIPKLQIGYLYGEPNCWLETACYLGVTLDTYLSLSPRIEQVTNKAAQKKGV